MTCLRRPRFFPSLTSFVKSKYLFLVILGGLFPASLPNSMFVNRAVGSSTQQTGCSDSYAPAVNLADGVVLSTEVVQMPTGLEHVSLLDIDVTKPDVLLSIVLAHNRLISPDETVTSMANRSNALAGINGDFYEINGPGRPIGMLMMNGKLLQSPTVYAVLGITSTQRLTFGFESFSGNVIRGTASHKLRAINHFVEINEGKLVLLTPDLGAPVSLRGDTVVALLQPLANSADGFRVVSVQTNVTQLPALSGQDTLFLQILMQKTSISLKLLCIFVNFYCTIKEHEIHAKKERTQHGTEIWFACSPGLDNGSGTYQGPRGSLRNDDKGRSNG